MASNRGKRKPYQVQLGPQASDLDAMFEELYRRLAELEAAVESPAGGAGAPHDLLSADHPDTTPAAEQNGDLVVGQAGKWARKAVGADGQHLVVVAGGPAWSNDGSGLDDLDATELVGTVPTASVVHNMLSAHHPDSTPAAVTRGAIIKGAAADADDLSAFWIDGAPIDGIPVSAGSGTQEYWIDGEPSSLLTGPGPVTWQRKTIGAAGTVPVSDGVDWAWETAGGSGAGQVGGKASRSTDFTLSDRVATPIVFDAAADDDAGYWSAGSPTRLTVPTGQDGWHVVIAQAGIDATQGGVLEVSVAVNGVKRGGQAGGLAVGPSNQMIRNGGVAVKLAAGDYVEVFVELTMDVVGATQTIKGGVHTTFAHFVRAASGSVGPQGPAGTVTTDAGDLTSGTLPDGRFPATLPAVSGANLTNLDASDLASGTVPDARFPATLPAASGINLTALNAANIASGVLATARGGTSVDIASAALPLGSGQIAFPAVQNPSADPNTFDDYERGDFTPTVGGSGGESGQVHSSQSGRYVKEGRLVHISFRVALSTLGTITGTPQIKGLPFVSTSNVNYRAQCPMTWANFATAMYLVQGVIITSVTAMDINGLAAAAVNTSGTSQADFTNTTIFAGTAVYMADA